MPKGRSSSAAQPPAPPPRPCSADVLTPVTPAPLPVPAHEAPPFATVAAADPGIPASARPARTAAPWPSAGPPATCTPPSAPFPPTPGCSVLHRFARPQAPPSPVATRLLAFRTTATESPGSSAPLGPGERRAAHPLSAAGLLPSVVGPSPSGDNILPA